LVALCYGAPTAYALTAPAFNAQIGLSYAGQTWDNTTDGNPVGSAMPQVIDATVPGHYSYSFGGRRHPVGV